MSLLLLEGFDDGLRDLRWTPKVLGVSAGSGLNRSGLLQTFTSFNRYLLYSAGTDEHATLTMGAWINHTSLGSISAGGSDDMWQFRGDGGGTIHTTVTPTSTHQLAAYRGTTLLGTTGVIWSGINVPKYIEIQVTLSDTVGVVKIWADGVVVLDLTNQDTKNGGTETVLDAVKITTHPGGVGREFEADDIYITNGAGAAPYNGNLGDVVVDTIFPDGNGNYSDFTGSDGNSTDNYLLVDESPGYDSDTTYVESSTDTHRDSYTMDDITETSGDIRGVIASAVVKNSGTSDNFQVSTRISSTDYDSATKVAGAGYENHEKVWQVSPATSSDWTVAEVNAAEFGIENVT